VSAPHQVAEAMLYIRDCWKELNLQLSGTLTDHDKVLELATLIRANASVVRDWSIQETTRAAEAAPKVTS
jgi:hypothetical protein